MPRLTASAPSVAARVLQLLQQRLLAIRGQGDFTLDLQGRVYLKRLRYDAEVEAVPAVFVARRTGGGATVEGAKPVAPHSDMLVVFDVVGAVERGGDCALAGEALLADIQRALELPDDLYLRDPELARDLLSRELALVTIETMDEHPSLELVGVGVACAWPHTYGDPSDVA